MLEAVPGGVERGVGEPVRAGEVDDDRAGGRLERRGPLVLQAGEDELRAGRESLVVARERRQGAVQARIEGACGGARQ